MNTMGITKRVIALFLLPVLVLTACASPGAAEVTASTMVTVATEATAPTATSAPPTPTMIPPTATAAPTATPELQNEGNLTVLVPQLQVDNGILPWVDDFTAKTGCKVTLQDFTDFTKAGMAVQMGLVDVIMAGASSGQFISDGSLVEKIEVSKIPSWEKIDPALRSATWNSAGEDFYGVPYMWIPRVLIYHTGVFPTPPDSWDVTFQEKTLPDGKSNRNRVLAPYEIQYIGDEALFVGATYLDLGIQDPFQLTEPQLAAVMEYLYQQQAIVQAYVDETTMTDYFKTGDAVLIRGIPRQVKLLVDAGIPVSSVIPKEGSTALAFTQLLAKNAANPVCAYQWMEYSLDAKVQGDTAAKFGANPSVPSACAGASELLSAADCEHNGASKISSFFFVQTPAKDCGKDRTNCVEFQRWVDEYNALVKP